MVPFINNHVRKLWVFEFFVIVVLFSNPTIVTLVHSKTDDGDVSALNVMYTSLNKPSKLENWKADGGDPCQDNWKGIQCSGSSITKIDLSDMGLTGSLGYQLANLKSVTYFDLSNNNLKNDIPYQLPPNADHIDLSENGFTGNVPYSISQMKTLKYLNLGRNQLNGQLSDMFQKLPKLTVLDLSFNKLSGDLPQSLKSLTSLSKLHLQNNQFTGSINMLRELPLSDLNVENNKFTGWIPNELESVKQLETGGNSWSTGSAPPPPPGQKFTSRANKAGKDNDNDSGKGLSGGAIAGIVIGILVVLLIVIALFSRRSKKQSSHFLDEERVSQHRPFASLSSKDLSNDSCSNTPKHSEVTGISSDLSSSINMKGLQSSPSIRFKSQLSARVRSVEDDEFAKQPSIKRSSSIRITCYPLADLQTATANFATGRLLGEGTIGRVYKAKHADGKDYAVKKIDSSLIQSIRGVDFPQIATNISQFHHPNIVELVGYCSEQGHNMLVYYYFRNGSLHEFLHVSDDFSKPLTWNTRVRIALGTARAIEYLHELCPLPSVHKNIKSSNILLDAELNPRLSDYGLAIFHQRTSQNLGTGYNAPECIKPSAFTMKSDVYSFGVVMLELLTGRMPFNSSKPKSEQSLVHWATPQLHDIDALEKMVDPALRGLYPPKSVSRFADIIALCVQAEPEFRPPMSEVVQSLIRVVQRAADDY